MSLPLGIARAVLADETFPNRFEQFSAAIVSKIEGDVRVITTSSNYDQGRDGMSVGAGPRICVCCSLTDNVDAKVRSDAKKLAKTTKNLDRLYFCSSQKLTEHASDQLAAELGREAGCEGKVEVLGRDKLAFFGTTHEAVLKHHYPAEVKAALQALAAGPETGELEHSLRLALSVAGAQDASSIREGVWASALRLVLSDGSARNAGTIAAALSNHLKLSSTLAVATVKVHLESQVAKGILDKRGQLYCLTEQGKQTFLDDEERVAVSTLQGRLVFREAVEQALRQKLSETQSSDMWMAIQDSLAALLYSRGKEVISLLAPLFGTAPSEAPLTPSDEPTGKVHKDIVEPLAKAAADVFQHKEQSSEVYLAISDLLHSGHGPAVDWLCRACFAFICACSLGLEARTQSALESVIARTALVLDTDVVLTYLSADETQHESVNALVQQWREFGGTVLVTEEVLLEVAHHAWIAQKDADQIADLLPGTAMDRQVLSKNAFVRGFGRLVEAKELKPSHWHKWMQQFKGRSATDLTAIRTTLIKDRGFGQLPPPNASSRQLAQQVQSYIERRNSIRPGAVNVDKREEFIKSDKARRDAQLFAALVQAVEQGHERGDGRTTYLVTSSARFRDVQENFRPGEPSFVLSVPAAAYIISMIPGRSLGLTALRSFLFDGRWQERVSDFELLALRIVKRSEEFDMPWAKRSQLLRELRSSVEGVARDRSVNKYVNRGALEEVEEQWMAGTTDDLPRALARALDSVASDRSLEAQLKEAKRQIKELQEAAKKR